MKACGRTDADLAIDGKHYRLESAREFRKVSEKLRGRKGVRWVDYWATRKRLLVAEPYCLIRVPRSEAPPQPTYGQDSLL